MTSATLGFGAALVVLCLIGSWQDVACRRLPNWLCLCLFALGLGFAGHVGSWAGVGWSFLHSVVVLLAGMGIFRLGWVGAGDAKFWSGVAAWFPLSQAPRLLVAIAASGLLLFLLWFIYRRARGLAISRASGNAHDMLPYGVAIATGACLTFWSVWG